MESELKALAARWQDAATPMQSSSHAKALAHGVWLRVNMKQLLAAVWHTAQCVLTVAKAKETGLSDPADVMDLSASAASVLTTGLAAFREQLSPAEYYACMMLSVYEKQCSADQFAQELRSFIEDASGVLPWYLGLSRDRADLALAALQEDRGAETLLKQLLDRNLVELRDGTLSFIDRHFEWGFEQRRSL